MYVVIVNLSQICQGGKQQPSEALGSQGNAKVASRIDKIATQKLLLCQTSFKDPALFTDMSFAFRCDPRHVGAVTYKGNDSEPPSWQHRQAQHLLCHCG